MKGFRPVKFTSSCNSEWSDRVVLAYDKLFISKQINCYLPTTLHLPKGKTLNDAMKVSLLKVLSKLGVVKHKILTCKITQQVIVKVMAHNSTTVSENTVLFYYPQ